MNSLKEHLLTAPDDQIDKSMFPLIKKWDDAPTSIQILEVLDNCIYASLASGFVVTLLQTLYTTALANEGKKHEANLPLAAAWRNRG